MWIFSLQDPDDLFTKYLASPELNWTSLRQSAQWRTFNFFLVKGSSEYNFRITETQTGKAIFWAFDFDLIISLFLLFCYA